MSNLKTHTRRYGGTHQALRRALKRQVDAGIIACWRCGFNIRPGEPWDLGHTDDGLSYAGPEHAKCNRGAAGKVGRERQLAPRSSRQW